MPDINQTPVIIQESMQPNGVIPPNNSATEGEYSYPNYYTMLLNMTNNPMTNTMNSYHSGTIDTSNGNTEGDLKNQENISPNEKGN